MGVLSSFLCFAKNMMLARAGMYTVPCYVHTCFFIDIGCKLTFFAIKPPSGLANPECEGDSSGLWLLPQRFHVELHESVPKLSTDL